MPELNFSFFPNHTTSYLLNVTDIDHYLSRLLLLFNILNVSITIKCI
jgi:hypothetical protein